MKYTDSTTLGERNDQWRSTPTGIVLPTVWTGETIFELVYPMEVVPELRVRAQPATGSSSTDSPAPPPASTQSSASTLPPPPTTTPVATKLSVWRRNDYGCKELKTTDPSSGPPWHAVVLRSTTRISDGMVIEPLREVQGLPRDEVYKQLDSPTDICTELHYDPRKVLPAIQEEKQNYPELELDSDLDYWERRGATWLRHHRTPRMNLCLPTEGTGGPESELLAERRTTVVNYADQRKDYIDDDWKNATGTKGSPTDPWTGLTTFYDDVRHPQIYEDDATGEGALPKGVPAPKEPTQAERDLHNLTHMPFRSWCKICLRAKSRGHMHRQIYERRP